jgi:hypothetical protein
MRAVIATVAAVVSMSCGPLDGTAPAYLIVESLEAAAGSDPSRFSNELASDVVTLVDGRADTLPDAGRVSLMLALKDPGPSLTSTGPSAANAITIDRYRVRFLRADGLSTPGVDVPHAFDGAVTATIRAPATLTFTLVRSQAKREPPLALLARGDVTLSVIADVTFYGRDQMGREVSVSGRISIHFANWRDQP